MRDSCLEKYFLPKYNLRAASKQYWVPNASRSTLLRLIVSIIIGHSFTSTSVLLCISIALFSKHLTVMDVLWHELKEYFGDGFTEGTSPLRFNYHVCVQAPAKIRNNTFHGIDFNEQTMPLFSAFGSTSKPRCTCKEIACLVKRLDRLVQVASKSSHPRVYTLFTGKNDASTEEACQFAMRDAIQWWAGWYGTVEGHYWKQVYTGFTTISDDLMLPPEDLLDGTFRFLGHKLSDVLDGLRSEGVHPDDVIFMRNCLLRQYILQYMEKYDENLLALLKDSFCALMQFRVLTAGSHGCAVALLTARGRTSLSINDIAVEMASVGSALTTDIGKELLGILQGEPTELVAGDRELRMSEARWVYNRCVECLDIYSTSVALRNYATGGFHWVLTQDRYRERISGQRTPLSGKILHTIASFRVVV